MVIATNNNAINRFNDSTVSQDHEFFLKGLKFYEAKNFNAAWTSYNEAIRINSREGKYYYGRAACSACLGQYNVAIVDYNTALDLSKTNCEKGWCHYDLAVVYCRMGEEQQAYDHLITAARLGHEKSQQMCSTAGITV